MTRRLFLSALATLPLAPAGYRPTMTTHSYWIDIGKGCSRGLLRFACPRPWQRVRDIECHPSLWPDPPAPEYWPENRTD